MPREPGERPAAVGIEVALLLGRCLVEGLIDERQGRGGRPWHEQLATGGPVEWTTTFMSNCEHPNRVVYK